ncbi:hypothetical protein [Pyrococcus kukulkanii]|uniref:Uncharacterized protein n=1 Tax=Pyrococcus kukulkanii TaxID=1609559 RepID=A0A127BBC6_9EURY|nr:hypothetical protein [Pyrococcus kukulkanii]AMM54638.1 hypothetical protein TQ32_09190 [Pyrococcus kukulkanii]
MSEKTVKQTIIEMGACGAASSINIALGVVACALVVVSDLVKHKNKLSIIKFFAFLLYPAGIYLLKTCNGVFGVKIEPLEGFGLAFGIFMVHSLINVKIEPKG